VTGILPGARSASELCQLLGEYKPDLHPRRAIVEEKFNGIRTLWLAGIMVTREGCDIEAAYHAQQELAELQSAYGRPMFFDMEYVAGTFEETLSAFRTAKPGKGVLHVFDAVPMEQWEAAGRTAPLMERKALLRDMQLGLGHKIAQRVGYQNADEATVKLWFDDIVARGGEGVVVKDLSAAYFRGRTRTWLKLKPADERTASGKVRHPARKVG
jgi:DNA ligase-1